MVMVSFMKKISIITIICILIDQIIKTIITNNLELYQSIKIINNFFNITYVRNDGAAWSILSGGRFLLILIGIISLILIYKYFIKDKKLNNLEIITYGLLLGGIIGNLIDRIAFGYVIDFLDFLIFNYNFPVFNIADTFIVISVFLIIIDTFRGDKNEVSSRS